MQALLLLADAAESANGKVSALGAGWSITGTPTPPMSLIVLIDCPWDQTNVKHKIEISLLDADGKDVTLAKGPLGQAQNFKMQAEFEAGRPPGAPPGTPLRQVITIAVGPGMPLTPGEKYEFHLSIDDEHMDSWLATFLVRPGGIIV